jgi:hypothetical protein
VGTCLGVDRLHEKPHLAQNRPELARCNLNAVVGVSPGHDQIEMFGLSV